MEYMPLLVSQYRLDHEAIAENPYNYSRLLMSVLSVS